MKTGSLLLTFRFNLEMAFDQEGGNPFGKGLVNHPYAWLNCVIPAKE